MDYKVVVLANAEKEVAEAVHWYDEQKTGLGDRFLKTVRNHIKQVSEFPEIYQLISKNYRQCLIDSFPYVVVFRLNKRKHEVVIVSVFHTSRKPIFKGQ